MSRERDLQDLEESIAFLREAYLSDRIESLDVDEETEVDAMAVRIASGLFGTPESGMRRMILAMFGLIRFGRAAGFSAWVYLAVRVDHHLRELSSGKKTLGMLVVGFHEELPS